MSGNALLQSVTRALHVLELASNRRDGITLSNISTGLNVNKQTAHHIVRTLIHEKFLEKVGIPPRYKVGSMLYSLTRRRESWNRRVLLPATPVAIRLAKQSRCDVTVGQYIAGMVIARLRVPGHEGGDPMYTWGWRMTNYGSALVYIAHLDQESINDYVNRHGLSESDQAYWRNLDQLHAYLGRIRRDGYLEMAKNGIFRTGAPVFDASGKVVSFLSAVKPLISFAPGQRRRCVSLVRTFAAKLSAGLKANATTVVD